MGKKKRQARPVDSSQLAAIVERTRTEALGPEDFTTLMALTAQGQKYPPGPAYVVLYGGTVLALLGLLMRAEQAGYLSRYLRMASVIGRHSLLAFVLQFYVYYVGLYLLRLPYSPLWPLLFVATALLQWGALYAWDLRDRAREASARLPAAVPASGAR